MEIAGGKATVARLRHGGGGEESHETSNYWMIHRSRV
jgi:hypothetical protein